MQIKNQKEQDFKFRCYKLTLGVMSLIETLPNKKSYWSLGDQVFRPVSSIGANIIEAKASSSKKEFINFYQISLKSANESKYWLGLIRDSKSGDVELASKLLRETEEIARIIAASVITMKNRS